MVFFFCDDVDVDVVTAMSSSCIAINVFVYTWMKDVLMMIVFHSKWLICLFAEAQAHAQNDIWKWSVIIINKGCASPHQMGWLSRLKLVIWSGLTIFGSHGLLTWKHHPPGYATLLLPDGHSCCLSQWFNWVWPTPDQRLLLSRDDWSLCGQPHCVPLRTFNGLFTYLPIFFYSPTSYLPKSHFFIHFIKFRIQHYL